MFACWLVQCVVLGCLLVLCECTAFAGAGRVLEVWACAFLNLFFDFIDFGYFGTKKGK